MADDLGLETVTAIVRGTERPPRRLSKTAAWIEKRYGVPVITVLEQRLRDLRRIVVWVRTVEQAERFRERGVMQQRVQNEIADFIVENERRRIFSRRRKLFVLVTSFDAGVLDTVTRSLGVNGHRAIEALIDDAALAEVVVFFQSIIFFVHTDVQKQSLLERSKAWQQIALDYLARDDEFGVVRAEAFSFTLDSKETLERDFAGNMYYYLK